MTALEQASLVYRDKEGDVYACREVDLEVRPGEFLGILGPSGSGKSSLLYMLSGLKVPTSGRALYRGRRLDELSDAERSNLRLRTFGFVFQHPFLVGYLSALENILVARPDADARDEAAELLHAVGLSEKSHRLPHELSGGERQRVCVARALLGRPEVVFCDEPTAALDHATGVRVMDLLRRHRGDGSLVVVTHDPTMLDGVDRAVHMAEGRVL
ncbi:MAG: ABC transporter ATP-binding protein [Fimbriimonadaceae bacterium]|nr:ABC transporter ATP-binding protein [Fimbriimonadaceae bacterium]